MRYTEEPLVSIIMPTHNRRKLLERAVDSVFEQTWTSLELVIIDDASTDDTSGWLENLQKTDDRVKVITNTESKGAAASRNIAIKNAGGDFITGLDDDDYWRPTRVERLMDAFEAGYSAVCSYDRMVMNTRDVVWKKPGIITHDDLLFYNRVGNQVLTKKEYLDELGGFDESLPSAQDYDLWIRLTRQFGPVKTVELPLQVVNMDDDMERISTADRKMEGYMRCYEKHKEWMSPKQRKYQEYRLKLAGDESVSWLDLIRSVPPGLYMKEITRKLFL